MFAAQTASVTLKLASIFSASKIRTVLIREINWFVVETDVCLGVTSPDEAVLWIPIRPGERAWKSPHARKGDTRAGVCSTIPEEKWGTTRSLGRWIRIFFSTDVTRSSQFLTVNIQDGPSKEKFADSKISGYVRTRKFDLHPDTCGLQIFCILKEKVAALKIARYVWVAP